MNTVRRFAFWFGFFKDDHPKWMALVKAFRVGVIHKRTLLYPTGIVPKHGR